MNQESRADTPKPIDSQPDETTALFTCLSPINQKGEKRNQHVLKVIIIVLSFILVFNLGISIGRRSTRFACRWMATYSQNFAGPQNNFLGDWRALGSQPLNSHGIFGRIIQVNQDQTFVLQNANNMEIMVTTDDRTSFVKIGKPLVWKDLQINDFAVIIGTPTSTGQIKASFVRILP